MPLGPTTDTIVSMYKKWVRLRCLLFLPVLCAAGCGEAWPNLTASLGGSAAGQRGNVGVIVLNNTPFQAVLTLGSYDQTDAEGEPDFTQFTLSGAQQLDPNSDGGQLSFACARVFSIGGSRLISLIEDQGLEAEESALVEGAEFFSANGTSQGTAIAFEVLLGVDFPCNSLLIFKLEVNEGGSQPFRIDFELIPSEDTR